jgi:chromosome segregation ATPase
LSDLLAVARGEKDRWRQESVSLATQHSQFLAECAGHEVAGQLVQQVRSLSTETLQSMRDCVPDDVVARVFPTLASSVDRDRLLDEEDLEARDFVRQVKLLVRSRSQPSAMLKAITSFCLRAERRVVHRLLNDFRMIVSDANRRSAASSLEEKRLRERLAELEDERKAVLMASADAKMRSVQLEQSVSDRDHQVSALRKALSDARIEAEEAKRVAEDVAALKDALTEKTTTCHSAVERVRGLEFELRETCVENDALRRKVAELENRCMEAETQQIKLRKDMDVLQLGAAALEKEYRESREEIANLYGERERTQREIAELLSVVHGEV